MDFNANLNEVLKYQRERLPVSAIHPELRFTRLGAVLREHATEPSDVGELAYQALTSDHKQPLELMPLHLLRDKMQEEPDHPLADQFDWDRVPNQVALDQAIRPYGDYHWMYLRKHRTNRDRTGLYTPETDPLNKIKAAYPNATNDDIERSVIRLDTQNTLANMQLPHVDPEQYNEEVHKTLLSSMVDPAHHYA